MPLSSVLSSRQEFQSKMFTQTGHFDTRHASKYLQQLCKHFAHKVDVSFDAKTGSVAFPFGPATLQACNARLTASICGEDADALARGRSVIDAHLKTFAFREAFQHMAWQTATKPAPQ